MVEIIDMRHALVKLAALIDWDFFEREWARFFPSEAGRPATPSRLVAGLLYLQHAYDVSDEAVVAGWVENLYYQHFCGETFFRHRAPIDPSSLTRWRNRIGEEGAEWLLTKTIQAGRASGAVDDKSFERVSVDTPVMEKNIAYPTDARLYERTRQKLVALARTRVLISGMRKGITPMLAKLLRRHSAIEAKIGHMKTDGRLTRCPLKGTAGDAIFAVLCACGHNIRKILAYLKAVLALFIAAILNAIWQRPAVQIMSKAA